MEELTCDMPDGVLEDLLGEDPTSLVLCGGSHVPFDRTIDRPTGAVRIINLGSVGEAPREDGVEPRFAHATFVESTDSGIEVEQFIVPLGWAA
jgi:hypothetical protein